MARLFKRGRVFYAWVPVPGGGTTKKSTNCTDEKAAHARAAQLERESIDPDSAAAATKTLRDALELLIRERAGAAKAGKGSKETVRFYQKKSGVLLDGLAEVLRRSPKAAIFLREVKAGLVDDYIAMRRDEAEDGTIAKELTTWRAACRLAKRRGWFPQDIEQVFPVGFGDGYTPRQRFVSPSELVALYRAMVRSVPLRKPDLEPERIAELRARRAGGELAGELAKAFAISISSVHRLTSPKRIEPQPGPPIGHELFAIVCFAIATGAEWSAIWRARRADVAADLSEAIVRGSKNENRIDRVVPIALLEFGWLLAFAREHGDGENGFLFSATHASSFRHRLSEACARAGIEHLAPTDLRRTHGKWLRLAGVAPGAIAPSLGHADARMVERVYGRSSAAELAHVQRAQIAVTGGLLMGGGGAKWAVLDGPGVASARAIRSGIPVPRDGIEPPTRGFSIPSTLPADSADVPDRATSWEANGQSDGDTSTATREAVPSRGDAHDPPQSRPDPFAAERGALGEAVAPPALERAARGLVASRATWNELDGVQLALEREDVQRGEAASYPKNADKHMEESPRPPVEKGDPIVERDAKPPNVVLPPPKKARPRLLEETARRRRGGRS